MKIIITIFWFLILFKCLLFWTWLWQLKEYHSGRFRAHFETQKVRKILSSFWRIKFPKFTKKILFILSIGVILEALITFFIFPLENEKFYFLLLIFLILSPVIFSLLVLFFQMPTFIWKKRILKRAARKIEKFKNLLVIGITGSYGKTSTKEFLAEILGGSTGYSQKVLKTKKHINSEIGIAQTILQELKPEHQIFIVEIGAYEKGKIKEVCQMIKPQIGILTGINEQHLSTFGSLKNIINGKLELIEALTKDGLAVLNGNNKTIYDLRSSRCNGIPTKAGKIQEYNPNLKNIKFISTKEHLDLWVENIRIEKEFLSFKVFARDGDFAEFKINVIGAQNIENILLACLTAKKLGIGLQKTAEICQKIKSLPDSLRLLKKDALNVLDATYSSNPQGIFSHLSHLKNWQGKKVIVMPCLIELGKLGKEIHQRIGEEIGRICDFAIITTKDYFKELKNGAENSGMIAEKISFIRNAEEIYKKIKIFQGLEDIILLESRVPKSLLKLIFNNGN